MHLIWVMLVVLTAAAAARARDFWSAFDLQTKRSQWDEIGLKIAQAQEVNAQALFT